MTIKLFSDTWRPSFPGIYDHNQENTNFRPRVYASDTWKIKPNLTLDYGVAWEYETGLFNSDLTPPAFLAPLYSVAYGPNSMHATHPIRMNFSRCSDLPGARERAAKR